MVNLCNTINNWNIVYNAITQNNHYEGAYTIHKLKNNENNWKINGNKKPTFTNIDWTIEEYLNNDVARGPATEKARLPHLA